MMTDSLEEQRRLDEWLRELQEEAEQAIQRAQKIVESAEADVRAFARAAVESLRGEEVTERIESEYDPSIESVTEEPEEQDLMKAIVFEETIHETPPFLESALEDLGFGDTVGPSQISVSKWSKEYDVSRKDVLTPEKHLDDLRQVAGSRGMDDASPAVIGTLWNNYDATEISDYGKRVERYYNQFRSKRISQ